MSFDLTVNALARLVPQVLAGQQGQQGQQVRPGQAAVAAQAQQAQLAQQARLVQQALLAQQHQPVAPFCAYDHANHTEPARLDNASKLYHPGRKMVCRRASRAERGHWRIAAAQSIALFADTTQLAGGDILPSGAGVLSGSIANVATTAETDVPLHLKVYTDQQAWKR